VVRDQWTSLYELWCIANPPVALTSFVWSSETSVQRAGCEARKSGSVRGAAGQPAAPTQEGADS
jgi:hypothetical protein